MRKTISEPNIMSMHEKTSSMPSHIKKQLHYRCNTTSMMSLPTHLLEPSLLYQLIAVVREEWSSIGEEGSSHQAVSHQIPHAHLQFLSGKVTNTVTSYYVHA